MQLCLSTFSSEAVAVIIDSSNNCKQQSKDNDEDSVAVDVGLATLIYEEI
jgi:hypothetical protein